MPSPIFKTLAAAAVAALVVLPEARAQYRPPSPGEIIDSITGNPDRRERAYDAGRRDAMREQMMRREERRRMRAMGEDWDRPRRPRCRIVEVRTTDRWGNRVIREREVCR